MGDHKYEGIRGTVDDAGLNLPPGFRFHPSDEEIITFYLMPKVLNSNFTAVAIAEADINNSEPWELPRKAKMGEKEWYFYCLKDHKYQKGERINRATNAGFWKATGKDKEIYQAPSMMPAVVGMKKTLVFYTGRAPRGEKTEWIMHEYRLEGSSKLGCPSTSSNISKDWVVCKVFHKSSKNMDVNMPPSEEATTDTNTDQSTMDLPASMQFLVEPEDFSIELSALCPDMDMTMPFYSTIDASSSVAPSMSAMPSMDIVDIDGTKKY